MASQVDLRLKFATCSAELTVLPTRAQLERNLTGAAATASFPGVLADSTMAYESFNRPIAFGRQSRSRVHSHISPLALQTRKVDINPLLYPRHCLVRLYNHELLDVVRGHAASEGFGSRGSGDGSDV
jgi:hypothetical protein